MGVREERSLRVQSFRLAASLTALRELNRALEQFAQSDPRIDPDGTPFEDLRLVMREAASNIVEHGRVPEPLGGLAVELSFDGAEFVVRLESAGVPFDPRSAPCKVPATHELAEGGYGIHLMRTLTDAIEYFPGGRGNVLILRKRFSRAEGGSS